MSQSKSVQFLLTHAHAIIAAGARAADEDQAKSQGLNIHYVENGYLIEETPDGKCIVLKAIDPIEE